jgi:hypothetical protein
MSISGIASSILSGFTGSHHVQTKFEQIRDEFKQLGQDLQAGNLSQAQQDFTALSQNLPSVSQSSASQVASQVSSATGATGSATSSSALLQEFNQLGQALQSGNLQAAQQDYTAIQQTAQQNAGTVQSNAQQVGGHHHLHHHHVESSEGTSSSASSSTQQTNAIDQAFSQLAQTLQSGNIQGAQQAFTALQADLQQIGGFVTSASAGSGSTAVGSLNVSA